ncbi:MAG TPA: cache domain-containing protein, partial [Aggregicoccus sp.]|nr:cache domain-containing protein [Aggregicoccus sp.]
LCTSATPAPEQYQHQDTRELVALVKEAAALVESRGEAAFPELRAPRSRWRQADTYVFVLDPEGNMRVHPDPALEGKNQLALKDVNGKPIIRGLIAAATAVPDKPEGWYHYEWPVPGGLLPRWKSSYVRRVSAPSGKTYVVGAGMNNDRMERAFVVDLVRDAVGQLEKSGEDAFALLRDPTQRFIAKDAYVFVVDSDGVELVNPAFPNLEGRKLLDLKDAQGKPLVREMLEVMRTRGSGWVDYQWPRPGESVPTRKSAYVHRARLGDRTVLVACGVYLADAPRQPSAGKTMTAPQLMALVRQAAEVLERQGEKAYPTFRQEGSKWFHDDVYLFVWTMKGKRVFHAADPAGEGQDVSDLKDVRGRPIGKMFLEAASSPSGEGWGHYLYPEPGSLFPIWKSTFVKRVTFPSGEAHLVGCGLYNMRMDRTLIEDVVERAAALVQERGKEAFDLLRDKTGPFVFMDTYVFVEAADGTELVNPGQPSLEGQNLMRVRDVNGKYLVRDYIQEATRKGSAWETYAWYRPGETRPVRKQSYVRKVQSGSETYFVGSGFYLE